MILDGEESVKKASVPMEEMELALTVTDEQVLGRMLAPKLTTLSGNEISVIAVPEKAQSPTDSQALFSSNVTLVKEEQPANAFFPMEVTDEGITTLLIAV